MVAPARRDADSGWRAHSPLAASLSTLAATPDDAPDIDAQLVMIAHLAADLVAPVSYASVTAKRDAAYTTVATSSQVALAVDLAQYADDSGPCLDALEAGAPFSVPSIAATMLWPGFRAAALHLGLQASLSIPLFAGSGAPVAVLNLYGYDPVAMAPLQRRVRGLFDPGTSATPESAAPKGAAPKGAAPQRAAHDDDAPEHEAPEGEAPPLDAGGGQLLVGLHEALAVRATIQRAIGVIMARERCTAGEAYAILRLRAAATHTSLDRTAAVTR